MLFVVQVTGKKEEDKEAREGDGSGSSHPTNRLMNDECEMKMKNKKRFMLVIFIVFGAFDNTAAFEHIELYSAHWTRMTPRSVSL